MADVIAGWLADWDSPLGLFSRLFSFFLLIFFLLGLTRSLPISSSRLVSTLSRFPGSSLPRCSFGSDAGQGKASKVPRIRTPLFTQICLRVKYLTSRLEYM
ncbi:hypothetical protein BDD12DRAFT_85792 [Trichophaea hybrida]|nr:hypothetical protein BDD12DRAFT_85792 [Trichophaea hybrida]